MKEKFKHLRFGQAVVLYDGYNQTEKFTWLSRRETIASINTTIDAAIVNLSNNAAANLRYSVVINSKLNLFKNLFMRGVKIGSSFLMLDCDSEQNARLVQEGLRQERIDYFRVSSSPGHYWYLCAKMGKVPALCDIMDRIQGVDHKYRALTRQSGRFVLRAFPKDGVIPGVNSFRLLNHSCIMDSALGNQATPNDIIAVLNNDGGLKEFLYLLAWMKEFKEYWRGFEENLEHAFIIHKQLEFANMLVDLAEQQERVLVSDAHILPTNPNSLYDYGTVEEPQMPPIASIDLSSEREIDRENEEQFDAISNIKL